MNSAKVVQHPAAIPPQAAVPPGPVSSPAPFSNPLTDKCAWASIAALQAQDRFETAMYAAEYALDEVKRCRVALDDADRQLSAAIKEARKAGDTVRIMATAFMERMQRPAGGGADNAGSPDTVTTPTSAPAPASPRHGLSS